MRGIFAACALVPWTMVPAQETAEDQILLGSIDFPASGSPDAQVPFRLGCWRSTVFGTSRLGTIRPLHMRDFHALDWQLDAYLRMGRLDQAQRIMEELDEVEAEISRRGEPWGHFPSVAETLRAYYASAVP